MIVNNSLVNELFRGFHIQRWNDRIRPMDLIEMDKHAHKMVIAYSLGKFEEERGASIDWNRLISNSIYELLRRIEISDIQSPIYYKVKQNKEVFKALNKYVFTKLEPKIYDETIRSELRDFLFSEIDSDDITMRVLDAAHIYASYWEFNIIKQSNPFGYQNIRLETELLNRIDKYNDLIGIGKIISKHTIANFIDMAGQLRFQIRWAQVPRVPKTAVLGHSMLVACINYFFARENNASPKRLYNAFFGGIFHDLPEAVTRDIISPVKQSSKEFDALIKDIEQEMSDDEIFPLIPDAWHDEIKYFIVDEFENKIIHQGKPEIIENLEDFYTNYNADRYSPFDGKLLRAADHLAAYLEVSNSISAGISTEELTSAAQKIKNDYIDKTFGNVKLGTLYSSFNK